MASCTPGDIQQISYTTDQLDKAIEQTVINSGRIVDHENRLSENETVILENSSAIEIINSGVDFASKNGDSTEAFQALDPVALQEVVTLNYLTNYTLSDAASLGGIDASGYALVGGSNTNIFKVSDDVSTDSAVSGQRMIDYAAEINGNGVNVFQVADPLAAQDAVPKAWADSTYISVGNTYTKAEVDSGFLGITATAADSAKLGGVDAVNFIQDTEYATDTVPALVRNATDSEALAGIEDTTYMTPAQIKAFCDANYVAS